MDAERAESRGLLENEKTKAQTGGSCYSLLTSPILHVCSDPGEGEGCIKLAEA